MSAVSEGEGDVLEGLHLLPGLQLRGRGRGRARGRGRGRGKGLGRGRRGRGSEGWRERDEEEVPAVSDLLAHTALLADPGAGQEEVVASLQALLRLEVNIHSTQDSLGPDIVITRPCKIQCTFYCHRFDKIISPLFVYGGPPPLGSK